MSIENRVVGAVVGTFIVLCILFAGAAVLSEDFRQSGALVVGAILGAIVSFGSIIIGANAAARISARSQRPENDS